MALLPLVEGAFASAGDANVSADNCSNQTEILALVYRTNPATIVSSILSLVGSLAIITPFLMWKDLRRSTARKILLLLAISDLFTAVGYLAASCMYYYFYDLQGRLKPSHVDSYYYFCSIQAFITTYFPITSFFWTTYLAVYFVVTLVFRLYHWSWRLLVFFNLTAWGIPLVICVATVSTGILGSGNVKPSSNSSSNFRSTEDAAGWCFVSSQLLNASSADDFRHQRIFYLAMEAVCGKMWEVLAYLIVATCYILIFASNRVFKPNKKSEFYHNTGPSSTQPTRRIISEALVKVDMKLLFIPLVFIFLRSWGTIRYFISWIPDCHVFLESMEGNVCVSKHCFNVFYSPILLAMQAFCDPLQGFGNAVLFVCLSKPIRHRLLTSVDLCAGYCYGLCWRCFGNSLVRRRSGCQGNAIANLTFECSYNSNESEGQDERTASADESSSMLRGHHNLTYGSTSQADGER